MTNKNKRILRRFKISKTLLIAILFSGALFTSCTMDEDFMVMEDLNNCIVTSCDVYGTGDILDDEVEPDEEDDE